jgi:hypothetical protein
MIARAAKGARARTVLAAGVVALAAAVTIVLFGVRPICNIEEPAQVWARIVSDTPGITTPASPTLGNWFAELDQQCGLEKLSPREAVSEISAVEWPDQTQALWPLDRLRPGWSGTAWSGSLNEFVLRAVENSDLSPHDRSTLAAYAHYRIRYGSIFDTFAGATLLYALGGMTEAEAYELFVRFTLRELCRSVEHARRTHELTEEGFSDAMFCLSRALDGSSACAPHLRDALECFRSAISHPCAPWALREMWDSDIQSVSWCMPLFVKLGT